MLIFGKCCAARYRCFVCGLLRVAAGWRARLVECVGRTREAQNVRKGSVAISIVTSRVKDRSFNGRFRPFTLNYTLRLKRCQATESVETRLSRVDAGKCRMQRVAHGHWNVVNPYSWQSASLQARRAESATG